MIKSQLLNFAQLSMCAYRDTGWEELDYKLHYKIDKSGVQAYIFQSGNIVVVAFRGSDEKQDWINDAKATFIHTSYGRMHKGFKKLWDKVSRELQDNIPSGTLVYFTGHSLGGALALISSIYILHQQVITFGCPMVLEKNNPKHLQSYHIRVVNNNDLITRLPSKALGYGHIGMLYYLSYSGGLLNSVKWIDRVKSHLKAWSKGQFFDGMYDHDLNLYIKKLSK